MIMIAYDSHGRAHLRGHLYDPACSCAVCLEYTLFELDSREDSDATEVWHETIVPQPRWQTEADIALHDARMAMLRASARTEVCDVRAMIPIGETEASAALTEATGQGRAAPRGATERMRATVPARPACDGVERTDIRRVVR